MALQIAWLICPLFSLLGHTDIKTDYPIPAIRNLQQSTLI